MSVFAILITICVGQTQIAECTTYIVPEYSAASVEAAKSAAEDRKRVLLGMHDSVTDHAPVVVAESAVTLPNRVLGYVADMIQIADGKYKHHFKTI